jgi:uncharacterized protein (TIGR03086 family)
MNLVDALEASYRRARPVVAVVAPTDLPRATPCAGWTVETLLNHYLNAIAMFPVMLAGQAPDWERQADLSNPVSTFDISVEANLRAWRAPGAADTPTPMLEPMKLIDLNLIDAVIHPWDLARSVGADYSPDPGVADLVLERWRQAPLDKSRQFGAFGPEVEPPGGSGSLQSLLAMTGRDPNWSPGSS